jgi:very-short-patch-repair endonuclease
LSTSTFGNETVRPPTSVDLRPEIDRRVNFAMQQNDVPVVKLVHVENTSELPLRDLRLRITPQPAFAGPWEARVDLVEGKSTWTLKEVDLALSSQYLNALTERLRGELRFELFQGDERIAECVEYVQLLAHDEWGGLTSLPEILAAFVMPNHPAIEGVLRAASDILGGWTGDPSLSGYQSKEPKRVYITAASIYAALQRLGITYVNPPASFESEGQRIRLPDRIAESRMGTCLDLAVMTAGCLEQAGLHPLVVVLRGHAITGVWLREECFSEPSVEEPLRLRKRVDLGEIAVFDPTCLTFPAAPAFDGAVQEAKRRLVSPQEFLCAIDIRRARKGQIRPIAVRVDRPEGTPSEAGRVPGGPAEAPDASGIDSHAAPGVTAEDEAQETPASRLDRWRRQLLDLSLRNRLLNFRDTKKTISLLCADLPALEDALAGGLAFQVLPRPKDLSEQDPRDPDAHRRRSGDDALTALLREELKAKRLYSDLNAQELDRRLLEVYRAARLGLEEGGASALYLAIGFLSWYETPESSQSRLAPILLLPLELHRKSVREGFTLRLADDEPRLNVTLLELLRQDHGVTVHGLEPLSKDESGLDVPRILRTFREAIRDIDRWDVLNDVQVGIFSFAKFLMWRDLAERSKDLMKNAVVDHLVNHPNEEFEPGAAFPDPTTLDEERSPLDTFCPLPADASQLAAVFAAAEGRSFVLEGPPGTGKSQTITNLIAHNVANGKRVLFVSEKMAALNVVHDRLQKVGLGRYCLELHSNKAHKQGVLAQLNDVLSHTEARLPENWKHEAERLASLRGELNDYVNALHLRRCTGETIFEATSNLIGLRNARSVGLHWPSPDSLDSEGLANLRDLVDRLAKAGNAVGGIAGHPWRTAGRGEWTPAWEQQVRAALGRLRESVETLEGRLRQVSSSLSFGEGASLQELTLLDEACRVLLNSPAPPMALLVRADWDQIQDRIGSWIEHGRRRDELRTTILQRFTERIIALDLDGLQRLLESAEISWWPAAWWRRRQVRKALQSVTKDATLSAKAELAALLDQALSLRAEEQTLALAGDDARELLGPYWKDGEANWGEVDTLREWSRDFRSVVERAGRHEALQTAELRERWARLSADGHGSAPRKSGFSDELLGYRSAYANYSEQRHAIEVLLELACEPAWGRVDAADALGTARRTLFGWSERANQLREWCAWRRARSEAIHNDLAPLVDSYERTEFGADEFKRVFDRSYYDWWNTAVVSAEPVLAHFFSPEHERRIEQFRATDERYRALTQLLIAARLAQKVPVTSTVEMPNSEVGILKREIGKRGRHMSVRKLFQTIPNLLPRLKPCLLMSPMSVAQYLDAGYPPFDLVVFDEASQIPVWDAVGAIARGAQVVVVGDPKQLPPTSFFERADSSEEQPPEDDTAEDLESILDDCLGARIHMLTLEWHYRSRHESLIAFSNYHYYANRLLTFPSPYREGMGVSWRLVPNAVYDRGKSATNRAEAEAVVGEILSRLHRRAEQPLSIGVVTFSQAQQTLIEDLLEDARRKDPKVDAFFAEEASEPVFVKNLENVQGDERDVILFSICYGPDSLGRVLMNFGPINRDGGERRLNVAITRARREVVVFSTLRADQIDLARTRARGVRDLKNFLEYAERGPSALTQSTKYRPDADFESPFEEAVCEVLQSKGWEVHRQVGCASYRIDLAVVYPSAPGSYLLGIECDGANYHRAKTARDRDKLREGILRDLGWELHRIWSSDWWTNPEQEIQKVTVALEAAGAKKRAGLAAPAESPVPPPAEPPLPPLSEPHVSERMRAAEDATSPPAEQFALPPPAQAASLAYSPRPVEALGTSDDFYQPYSDGRISEITARVVKDEGPITLTLATRRVAAHWGLERIHEKALDRVRGRIPKSEVQIQAWDSEIVLWPAHAPVTDYKEFRVPDSRPDSFREACDLPLDEIANGVLALLRPQISVPEGELIREVSHLFGFQRMGKLIEDRVRLGIDRLVQRGSARREGDSIVTV